MGYFCENNKKLLIIDVFPNWCGPCDSLNSCYKNIQTNVVDEFEKRIDIVQVAQEKLEGVNNDKFKVTSKPKIILAL